MAIPFPTSLDRAPSPMVIEAMRLSEEGFEAALAGAPCEDGKPGSWKRGHERGTIFRKVAHGLALGFMGQASRCRCCDTVHWGVRSQCCGQARIDHGALIKTAETGDGPAVFMTASKIRLSRLPLIDLTTGDEILVDQRKSAA